MLRRIALSFLASLGIGLILAISYSPVSGSTPLPADPAAKNVSILLVIDSSGSMEDSDPNNLRRVSAQLLTALLDPGDELGFVEFSTDVVRSLEMTPIRDAGTRQALINRLAAIETTSGLTDMAKAFARGCEILGKASAANERYVVFLTDGAPFPEPGWNNASQQKRDAYEEQVRQQAAMCGARLIAVGLSDEANISFLESLPGTGGKATPITSSQQLPETYLDIFGRLADRYVPETQSEQGRDFNFEINAVMLGVTFVLVRTDIDCGESHICLRLVSPGGNEVSAGDPHVEYHGGKDFAVLTIQRPNPGRWRVPSTQISDGTIHVIVRSRLRLGLFEPRAVQPVGQPVRLEVRVLREQDSGQLVPLLGERDRVIEVEVTRPDGSEERFKLRDNGTEGDEQPGDGTFTGEYMNAELAGIYELRMTTYEADIPVYGSGEFQLKPFPAIAVIEPASTRPLDVRLGQPVTIRARLLPSVGETGIGQRTKLLSATATFQREDGRSIVPLDLKVTSDAEAIGEFKLDTPTSSLQIIVEGQAEYLGIPYKVRSQPMTYRPLIQEAITHSLTGTADFGRAFTVGSLKHIQFRARAWSAKPLPWKVIAQGIPGLHAEIQPKQLPAGTDTTVDLWLTYEGSPLRADKRYSGILTFEAGDIPITPAPEIPFQFAIGQATLVYSIPSGQSGLSFGQTFHVDQLSPLKLDVIADSESPITLRATVQGQDNVQVALEPSTIPPNTPVQVFVRLSQVGKELKPGTYTGTIAFEASQATVLPVAQVGFRFAVIQPTLRHTLRAQNLGMVTNLRNLPPIQFEVDTDLPSSRTLSVRLVDQNGERIPDIEAEVTPSTILSPKTRHQLELQLHPKGRAGLFSAWQRAGFIELSAGPGVEIMESSKVAFNVGQPSVLRQVWEGILHGTRQVAARLLFPLFFVVLGLLVLYFLVALVWLAWHVVRGRPFSLTLTPVTVDAHGVLHRDETRASEKLRPNRWQSRAFGLAMGQNRVPLAYRFPTVERLLARIWVRFGQVETPDRPPPSSAMAPVLSTSPDEPVSDVEQEAEDPLGDLLGLLNLAVLDTSVSPVTSTPTAVSRLKLRFRGRRNELRTIWVVKLARGTVQRAKPPRQKSTPATSPAPTANPGLLIGGFDLFAEGQGRTAFTFAPSIRWERIPLGKWVNLADKDLLKLDNCVYQIEIR